MSECPRSFKHCDLNSCDSYQLCNELGDYYVFEAYIRTAKTWKDIQEALEVLEEAIKEEREFNE